MYSMYIHFSKRNNMQRDCKIFILKLNYKIKYINIIKMTSQTKHYLLLQTASYQSYNIKHI